MPYARCNVQYSFLLPSPGWVCVWGSSQEPVRVQQFLAKKNMEDGNMAPRACHMFLDPPLGPFFVGRTKIWKQPTSGWRCTATVSATLTRVIQASLNTNVDLRISHSWHRRRGHDASWGVQCSTKCRSVFWTWPRIQRDLQRWSGICELNNPFLLLTPPNTKN